MWDANPYAGFLLIGNAHNTFPARYPGCPLLRTRGLIVGILRSSLESLGTSVSMISSVAVTALRTAFMYWRILDRPFRFHQGDFIKKMVKKDLKIENQHLSEAPQNEALHLETYDGIGCTSKVQNMLNTHSAAMQSKQHKCSHMGNNSIPSTVLTLLWTAYYKDSLLHMIASDRTACDKKPHNTHRLGKNTDFVSNLIYFACVW